jgi:hypothetical protein
MEDYWDTKKTYYYISWYIGKSRFQELYIRYKIAPQQVIDIYDKVRVFITVRLVYSVRVLSLLMGQRLSALAPV